MGGAALAPGSTGDRAGWTEAGMMSERITDAAGPSPRFRRMLAALRRFKGDEGGATALEYAMIGGLIFAVIAGSLKLYGSKLDGVYGQIGNTMAQVY